MLNLTRDTTSDVEFGAYGDTGLTDLTFVFDETGINSSTRCTYFSAKGGSKFIEEVEIFL